MEHKLLEFSKKLEEKKVNDIKINELLKDPDSCRYFTSYIESINFQLTYTVSVTGAISLGNHPCTLLTLDQ